MAEEFQAEAMSDLVDDEDRIIGCSPRSLCHGDPSRVHRAVHVLVFNGRGEVLLQKRSVDKQIQPGRWDSSVGGHLEPGEGYREAAVREMGEELGIVDVPLTFLYRSRLRNEVESENIETFLACHEGPFAFSEREISSVRFWSSDEVSKSLGRGILTPNFEDEWHWFLDWCRRYTASQDRPLGVCAGDSFPDLFTDLQEG